jgi:hypothetical protein
MTIFLHPVRIKRNFGLARLYCNYNENEAKTVRFQVLTATSMKMAVFWDVNAVYSGTN